MRRSFGNLTGYPVSQEIGSMQIIDSIIRIPVVIELDERILAFDQNVPDSTILLEESLYVFFSSSWRNPTHVNSG